MVNLGYGRSMKAATTTRRYPNMGSQDTQYIPKILDKNGKLMTLQDTLQL